MNHSIVRGLLQDRRYGILHWVLYLIFIDIKYVLWSVVKSTFCSSQLARFNGQRGSSQPSVSSVLWDLKPSPGIHRYWMHMVNRHLFKKHSHCITVILLLYKMCGIGPPCRCCSVLLLFSCCPALLCHRLW